MTGSRIPRLMNMRGEYRVRNASEGDTSVTEILLYDEIGESWWGGISAASFVKDLQDVDTDEIHLRINSPGGDVFEGITILNAIRRHKAKVTTFIDGLAASAASFIAMGGDEIVMSRNAEMMIHDAWGLAIGNADDMAKMAEDLNRISDNIASIYADQAGGKTDEWRAAMKTETWYSDKEAVEAGLATRIEASRTASDKSKNKFNLNVFAHAGRADAPAPKITKTPAEPPETPPNQEGSDMSDTLNKGLRERLGLSADATDEEILAKLDSSLQDSDADPDETDDDAADDTTEDDADETDDADADETDTDDPAAAGVVTVDKATLNSLKADAKAGRQAREQQQTERREGLVMAAIRDGRITPGGKKDWLNKLKNDPNGEKDLAGLAKGLVPVDPAHGYTGGVADVDGDDYYDLFPDEDPKNQKKGA